MVYYIDRVIDTYVETWKLGDVTNLYIFLPFMPLTHQTTCCDIQINSYTYRWFWDKTWHNFSTYFVMPCFKSSQITCERCEWIRRILFLLKNTVHQKLLKRHRNSHIFLKSEYYILQTKFYTLFLPRFRERKPSLLLKHCLKQCKVTRKYHYCYSSTKSAFRIIRCNLFSTLYFTIIFIAGWLKFK